MVNVHASGGVRMLTAAREALDKHARQPLLTAVTVLTSMTDDDLRQTGVEQSLESQVIMLARLARHCGLDGVISSAREVKNLRTVLGRDFILVTPGIRPAGTSADDQSRTMTPVEAIRAGSNYLVIGRPVTHAPDPLARLIEIDEEIKNVKYEA
jgi:orotidine-5'-phosphate decarboxylase